MNGEFRFDPVELIREFDRFLAAKKVKFEATLAGSAALNLLGVIKTTTVDIDILAPKMSAEIKALAEEFRQMKSAEGMRLRESWLSDGVQVFFSHYPKDWKKRSKIVFKGKAITLHTFGRPELIKEKLWGYCNLRGTDKISLRNLKPTKEELLEATEWVKTQEKTTPFWEETVDEKLKELLRDFYHET